MPETKLVVDVAADKIRLPLSRTKVEYIVRTTLRAEKVANALISIAFVSSRAIAKLNKSHLNHAGPTDVISFGFARGSKKDPVIGDVYVCPDVARKNAAVHGVGIREEISRLIVHGTLHVLGYEHPEDGSRTKSAMWRRQEAILARIN